MTAKRMFWLLFVLLGFGCAQVYSACGPGGTTQEPGQETTTHQEGHKEAGTTPEEGTSTTENPAEPAKESPSGQEPGGPEKQVTEPVVETNGEPQGNDGGTEPAPDATPESPVTEQSTGAVQITFNPKSGSQIDVKDVCIDVTFSVAVDKTSWEVTWQAQGKAASTILLPLDSAGTSARICFQDFLTQNTQYTLSVKVQDANTGGVGTATATYTTKAPYSSGKAAASGLTVDLLLDKVLEPSLLNTFLGSISPNQLLPILMHLHSRDTGTSGSIVMVGGLGKPSTGNPHQGKDVFDNTKDPVSIAMAGQFEGNLFTAGPATFRFALGNINLVLEQFRLSGLFNAAGDNLADVRFSGLVDAAALKTAVGLDVCTILVGKCFKDKSGRTVLQMVGQMKSIINPVSFSALITQPLYLQDNIGITPTLEIYLTEPAAATDGVTMLWSTCKNSGDPNLPCDPSKGAVVSGVTVNGTLTLDASKKKATYAVTTSLTAGTWYRVAITAKDANGKTYTTFTIFKTL